MTKKYITIQDAAELSGKSVQTIRRAIKSKKLSCRKQKTPQGFNYLVSHESLCEVYKIKIQEEATTETKAETKTEEVKAEAKVEETKSEIKEAVKAETKTEENNSQLVTSADFKHFTKSLDRMINQHSEERQNFMRLVNTLQEKIFVLENQLNLLKEPAKNWYHFWK